MPNEIRDTLERVMERIRSVEAELVKLQTAAEVLRGLEAWEKAVAAVPVDTSKTETIRRILRERGRATTKEIIRAVRLAFPDAGTSGVRSILSLGRGRGEFRREAEYWMIVEKNEAAANSSG